MKTIRHNIYEKLHRNLRTNILAAGMKLNATDFANKKAGCETLDLLKKVFDDLQEYVRNADHIILHKLVGMAPYVVALSERANEKNLRMAISLKEEAKKYSVINNETDLVMFGEEFTIAFFEFTASVLQNLNKEASVINELLWSAFDDEELMKLESELRGEDVIEMVKELSRPEAQKNGKSSQYVKQKTNTDMFDWLAGRLRENMFSHSGWRMDLIHQ